MVCSITDTSEQHYCALDATFAIRDVSNKSRTDQPDRYKVTRCISCRTARENRLTAVNSRAAGLGLEHYMFSTPCHYFVSSPYKIAGKVLRQSPRLSQPRLLVPETSVLPIRRSGKVLTVVRCTHYSAIASGRIKYGRHLGGYSIYGIPTENIKQSYTYSNAQTPTYSIYGKFGMRICITVLPIPYME